MKTAAIVVVASALLASGCASMTSPARMNKLEPGHSYWFDYDASRRGMVMALTADAQGRPVARTCAEPAPDVAMQIAANAGMEISAPGSGSGGASGSTAQAARVLSERTQMVMFFREALFRVCEISLNQNLESAHVVQLYQHIIDTALKLGSDKAFDVEMMQAVADLEQRKAEREQAADRVRQLQAELDAAKGREQQRAAQAALQQAEAQERVAREQVQQAVVQLSTMVPAKLPVALPAEEH